MCKPTFLIKRKISSYTEDESCRNKRRRFIGSGEADSLKRKRSDGEEDTAGENKKRMLSDDDTTIIMDWEGVNTMEEDMRWDLDRSTDAIILYMGEEDPMEEEGVIESDVFSDRGDEDAMEEDMEWDLD